MKRFTVLRTTAVATAIVAAFATTPASALTAQANLAVSASVAANCTISTSPMAFGAYDPVVANASTDLTGSGSVTVACTKGATSLSIGLGNGNNFSSGRRMAGGGDFLAYSVYQPPNNTPGTACSYTTPTAWGNAAGSWFVLSNAPSKAARTYNICGSVAAGQDVTVASYSDTVVATITF